MHALVYVLYVLYVTKNCIQKYISSIPHSFLLPSDIFAKIYPILYLSTNYKCGVEDCSFEIKFLRVGSKITAADEMVF